MRFSAALLLALPALAMATAVPRDAETGSPPKCSSGPVWCCNEVDKSTAISKNSAKYFNLLHLSLLNVKGPLIGTQCSPLSVIGVGGGTHCSTQTVCCNDVHQSGLVNVGCTPINVGL
ncbi:fungal hydrophobin-domain-containing protein [Schizophyllum commune]